MKRASSVFGRSLSYISVILALWALNGTTNRTTNALAANSPAKAASGAKSSLASRRWGGLALYGNSVDPKRFVMFLSGDGGWNLGVIDMAKRIADQETLVVGLDIRKIFKSMDSASATCSYPAAQLEGIAKSVQKKLHFKQYLPPLLVGYSSGATLVYGVLAQAPISTFAGGVSLGFCPDLEVEKKMCAGRSLRSEKIPKKKAFLLEADPELGVPWVVLHGTQDQVCRLGDTQKFLKSIKSAKLIELPKVGHGFSVQKNWMPQFESVFAETFPSNQTSTQGQTSLGASAPQRLKGSGMGRGSEQKAELVSELPLIWKRAEHSSTAVIFLSGDGGWATLDDKVSEGLVQKDVTVVGVNMLSYLWEPKTPQIAAKDFDSLVAKLSAEEKISKLFMVGYSAGADVIPLILSEMKNLRLISGAALIAPSQMASFEFHISDWLEDSPSEEDLPLAPALKKLTATQILCIYGTEEEDSVCPELKQKNIVLKSLPGGHHFGGDYDQITSEILKVFFSVNTH